MIKNEINIAYDTAKNLEKIVLRDAKAKADEITESIKLKKKAAVANATLQAKACASEYTQKQCALIDSECASRIAAAEGGAKCALMSKRSAVQTEVYKRLRERLCQFTKTKQYSNYVRKSLETIDARSLTDNITVFLSSNPTDADAARSFFPSADLQVSGDIGIGGVIVYDRGKDMIYDLTLDEMLKTVMPEFFEISGLKVEF